MHGPLCLLGSRNCQNLYVARNDTKRSLTTPPQCICSGKRLEAVSDCIYSLISLKNSAQWRWGVGGSGFQLFLFRFCKTESAKYSAQTLSIRMADHEWIRLWGLILWIQTFYKIKLPGKGPIFVIHVLRLPIDFPMFTVVHWFTHAWYPWISFVLFLMFIVFDGEIETLQRWISRCSWNLKKWGRELDFVRYVFEAGCVLMQCLCLWLPKSTLQNQTPEEHDLCWPCHLFALVLYKINHFVRLLAVWILLRNCWGYI